MAAANIQNPTVTIEIDAEGCCKVTKEVEAKEGQQVTFDNQAKTPITIWFPEGKPFGREHLPIPSTSSDSSEALEVNPKTGRNEPYPYAVFCTDRKEFGYGSAMPIIIVPPRE